MSPAQTPGGPIRVWFAPAGSEPLGTAADGTPIVADATGVAPMTFIGTADSIHFGPLEDTQ